MSPGETGGPAGDQRSDGHSSEDHRAVDRDDEGRRVRVEYLAPAELDAAIREYPVAYLPLGSIEFHSSHLPVGLDALNAHGLCVRAAANRGGLVLPPIYQGTGGGHTAYPWTIMIEPADDIRPALERNLARLQEFGVRVAVLFTGHFADEQLDLIDRIAAQWSADPAHRMAVVATGVNRCETSPIAPDHAGVFETTLLYSMWPELVHVDRLPRSPSASGASQPESSTDDRDNPANELWGIFGPDPRQFDRSRAAELREHLVRWLSDIAEDRLTNLRSAPDRGNSDEARSDEAHSANQGSSINEEGSTTWPK
jgi:creatinine amidohydrolase